MLTTDFNIVLVYFSDIHVLINSDDMILLLLCFMFNTTQTFLYQTCFYYCSRTYEFQLKELYCQ